MRLIDADALKANLIAKWSYMDDQDFANKAIWREIEDALAIEPMATPEDVSYAYENGYLQGKFEAWEWIRCEEKLPEDQQMVLITNSKGNILCGKYQGIFDQDIHSWHWLGNTISKVKAWLPAPPPYKK